MKNIFFLVSLLGHLVFASGILAGSEVPSNLEVAEELTKAAAEKFLSMLPAEVRSSGIALKPRGGDEKYEFILDVFSSIFAEGGLKVYAGSRGKVQPSESPGAEASPMPYELEIQALEFAITYPKIYRSHLIGGKRVKRSARVKLSATLLRPDDGSVVWVKQTADTIEDHFPYRLLGQVEDDLLKFTKPEREGTNWGRIVEPVVVSGIIVGLIYLFFSNQSGD